MRRPLTALPILCIALACILPAAAAGGPTAAISIVGGSPASIKKYPWQAALVRSSAKYGVIGNDYTVSSARRS